MPAPDVKAAALEMIAAGKTQAEAAAALGIRPRTLSDWVRGVRSRAVRGRDGGPRIPAAAIPPEGFVVRRNSGQYDADGNLERQWIESGQGTTDGYEIPPGHVVKGESVLLDANDNVLVKWVKTKEGEGASLADALVERFAKYEGAAPLIPAPAAADDDLLTVYPLADLHVGMFSWGKETGDDYDVDIATDLVRKSVSALVAKSEPSRRAVLLGLGDLFHMNDQRNVTPRSGHRLDADGRWCRVYQAGAELIIHTIDLLLQKHEEVDAVFVPGNHDEDAAVTLRVAMSLFYKNNPRVRVYSKPGLHWYQRFGKCLLGATHGHTMKPTQMAMMLATDRAKDWGDTVHRHFFFGHIHHETAREVGPVRVESFQTPAARDAHAHDGGYRSGRSMSAITFHHEEGEIGRHRVNIAADWARVRRRLEAA